VVSQLVNFLEESRVDKTFPSIFPAGVKDQSKRQLKDPRLTTKAIRNPGRENKATEVGIYDFVKPIV